MRDNTDSCVWRFAKAFQNKVSWGVDLSTEHERWLTDEVAPVCIRVIGWVCSLACACSIAMELSSSPTTLHPSSPSTCASIQTAAPSPPWISWCVHLLFLLWARVVPYSIARKVPRVGELVGGSVREERLGHLEKAMETAGTLLDIANHLFHKVMAWHFFRAGRIVRLVLGSEALWISAACWCVCYSLNNRQSLSSAMCR
jgi:hypothetical protein